MGQPFTDHGHDGPEHTQVWFGPESRPLFGWVSRPAGGLAGGGAVLCPPMGEEGRAAHRTFRRLAEELAAAGIVALRFDYDGTGDSAGLQDDPDRVPAWLASIEAARQYLLDLGASTVAGVGMRLGATLAAARSAEDPFSSLVLWDPCLSGRTFLLVLFAVFLMAFLAGGMWFSRCSLPVSCTVCVGLAVQLPISAISSTLN